MAQFVISIRNDTLKSEIEDSFIANFANPDNLSGEALVLLHVSNFLREVLNSNRVKQAVSTAESNVVKETTLI